MNIGPFTILFALCTLATAIEWRVDPAAAPGGDGSPGRPFAALPMAVEALHAAPQEPLTLVLASGVHRIREPIILGAAELRGRALTIRGEDGAVVSGGRKLTGWRIEDGRWSHPWDNGPIRELFVDGRRAARSRFPAEGWLQVEEALPDKRSGFTSRNDLPAFKHGFELLVLHDWSISRAPGRSVFPPLTL
jgi:hypothetical protein